MNRILNLRCIPTIMVGIAVLALAACEENYDDQEKRLIDLISEHRMGYERDYWLELRGYKVALIFGYGSEDREVCLEIAESMNTRQGVREGRSEYQCVAAN